MKIAYEQTLLTLFALLVASTNTFGGGVCFKATKVSPSEALKQKASSEPKKGFEPLVTETGVKLSSNRPLSETEYMDMDHSKIAQGPFPQKDPFLLNGLDLEIPIVYECEAPLTVISECEGEITSEEERLIEIIKKQLNMLERKFGEIEQNLPPNCTEFWFSSYEVPSIFREIEKDLEEVKIATDYFLGEATNEALGFKFCEFFAKLGMSKRSFQKDTNILLAVRKNVKDRYIRSLINLVETGRDFVSLVNEILEQNF